MAKHSQTPGDVRHCSETVFHDNFVIFRRRWKRIAFLESVNFFFNIQIFNFPDGHVTNFLAPFRGLFLPNAWSQTLQTSKSQTPESRFPSVPLIWGKTVSNRLCAG